MIPFVERNYNLVELGPRGTGKSHLFQQISPYAHLISGGKATVAKMFVNNATGQRGLVCQYDVVCFDEVSGISFDQKDGVNIMKGYMASGQFSRGKENIRAEGSIVMVGNFDVDVEQQQRIGHLLSPLPPEMRNDTAFMDRIHAYAPGWDFPKLNPSEHLTDHFGFVSDFLSECWSRLRDGNRVSVMQGRVHLGGALSGRDIEAVNKTVSGLIKLLFPDPEMPISDEDLEWIVRLALESRRRVKEQQKRVFKSEFRNTHFSYILGADGVEQFVVDARSSTATRRSRAIRCRPARSGASASGRGDRPGLYRIEVTCGPGGGVKILNQPTPPRSARASASASRISTRARRNWSATEIPARRSSRSRCGRWMRTRSGAGLGVPCSSPVRRAAWAQHAWWHDRRRRAQSRRLDRDDPERSSHRGACDRQAGTDAADAGLGTPAAERSSRRSLDQDQHRVLQGRADAVFKAWSNRKINRSRSAGGCWRHVHARRTPLSTWPAAGSRDRRLERSGDRHPQ